MYLEPVSETHLQLIYDEFNTNKEAIDASVKELIRWMEQQPYLPNIKDEYFLRNYLLRCKNDVDRTKKTLERYYVTKAKMPEIFTNRDLYSEDFQKSMDLGSFTPLPKLTPEGYRIGVFTLHGHAHDTMPSVVEFVKSTQILGLLSLKYDLHKKSVVIVDASDLSFSFLTLLVFSLRRLLNLNTKVLPFRFHKIYVMNALSALDPAIAIAKTFAKKEVGDRIEIWKKKPTDLVEVLPAEILPSDFGGTERSIKELTESWTAYIRTSQTWMNEEEKEVADLKAKKKFKKTKNNDRSPEEESEISFRDLNVD